MKKIEAMSKSNLATTKPEKDAAKAASKKVTSKKAEPAIVPSTVQTKTEAAPRVQALKAKTKAKTKVPEKTLSKNPAPTVPEAPETQSSNSKITKKAPVINADSSAQATEISAHDRVGLTAGAIWHYLAANGPGPVDKLIKSLSEETTIIQRGIGWLAQEDKITLTVVDGKEVLALTE